MAEPIYLDYQATTPLAPEVFEAMVPWLRDHVGNPHSAHLLGRKAAAAVAVARKQIAALMPSGGSIIFTASATEAINLALGIMSTKDSGRILCPATEHAAMLDTAKHWDNQGKALSILSVNAHGLLDIDSLGEALAIGDVGLVATMLVNNEIGVIQEIERIGTMARSAGAIMLCDAVQGFGRMAIPEAVDLVAISGHKIHGPKGIGALWIRDGLALPPLIHGGGQEAGVRSGTLSPALCVGLSEAVRLAQERAVDDDIHVAKLAEQAKILFADWTVNGSTEHRYAGNLNIRRDGLDVARLMSEVRGVAFSAGSACASGSGRPSHVLAALGLEPAQIKSSIRLGFGRYTTIEELERAAYLINQATEAQGL